MGSTQVPLGLIVPLRRIRRQPPGDRAAAVDELAHSIEVTSVTRGLGDHVQDGVPQAAGREAGKDLPGPLRGRGIKGRGGNDDAGELCLLPVPAEHGLSRHVRGNLPGSVSFSEVHTLACGHCAEPEPLNIKGEMPHKAQARPSRRQDRAAQGFIRKALQYPEYMGALIVRDERRARLSSPGSGCRMAPAYQVMLVAISQI
jgi:hypothetical protein